MAGRGGEVSVSNALHESILFDEDLGRRVALAVPDPPATEWLK
jgi:hypothetical protein